jgi:hypothetical protein
MKSAVPKKHGSPARGLAAAAPAATAATALRVLTIIACKTGTRLTGPVRVLPDGNRFLQDVFEAIDPLARSSDGALAIASASNSREIQSLLAEHAPRAMGQPFTVQLVGHGSSGRLALGSAWPAVPGSAPRTGATLFACVNELLLLKPATPEIYLAELRLVACDVARHDGEPLLSALAYLFDCDVTGARGDTSAVELVDGLYAGPMRRFDWAGLRYVR